MHLQMYRKMKNDGHVNVVTVFSYWVYCSTCHRIMKKDESEYLNQQGKNYLNYAISYTIYGIASLVLTVVLIGYLTLFVVGIAGFVYTILAILAMNKGEDFVVPFTIEIIK